MITTLLVANRGEIARRVARTAAEMGIRTVAVYSAGDREMPFVQEAEVAVALPGRTAAETYLNIDAVVGAALSAQADAVHPGYGFLSENPAFARAVIAAGLIWVGPPPEVIEVMGDKVAAKRIMGEAGVPVLPTWDATTAGEEIVYPVLVKAAAGGGGKGMRTVSSAGALAEAVAAARRESQGAFGDDRVFLERLVQPARHVEIQVLADGFGNVVHCFERECSIQRRHQKIVEECPSPFLSAEQRDRMGAAALTAARAVGYVSAGTVEFVVEPDGRFWFLEVNTRLQVEHPVTEAVTGLDLVREQLRIADGDPLSVTQDDLRINGHAIEVRLYAEDPASGFLPCTGTLVDFRPAGRPEVRWDSGVETGSRVGVEFDPLLAKVISRGPTRREAAGKLALALERSMVRGLTTNREFLVSIIRSPEFLAGDTTTDFVERVDLRTGLLPAGADRDIAALGACLALRHRARARARVLVGVPPGWRNSVMPPERVVLGTPEGEVAVEYRSRRQGDVDFTIDGSHWDVGSPVVTGEGFLRTVSFETGGRAYRLDVLIDEPTVYVRAPGGDVRFSVVPRFPEAAGGVPEGGLVSPMPARVVTVEVSEGEEVVAGQLLVVVEAMKMEHRVVAPHAGRVTELRARPGDQVASGELLVVLDTEAGA